MAQVDPTDASPQAAAAPQYFYNFTAWRNVGRGANCRNVGAAVHIGYNLVENGGHDFGWRMLDVPSMQYAQTSFVRDLLAVGAVSGLADGDKAGFFGGC